MSTFTLVLPRPDDQVVQALERLLGRRLFPLDGEAPEKSCRPCDRELPVWLL